jgi:hypothetical protein
MPEELFHEIHAAVHKFFQTVKTSPQTLHPDLARLRLNEKKLFLFGASFGGTMTVRHGQLYPGTFDGYISHDGVLSTEAQAQSDILMRGPFQSWLNPSADSEVEKTQEPVLILQNRDDNNVNIKSALDYYSQLQKHQKANLASVLITTAPSKMNPNEHELEKMMNKGHYAPQNNVDSLRYMRSITDFMERGASVIPAVADWQTHKYGTLANKFYKGGSLQERFVGELLEEAQVNKELRKQLTTFAHTKVSVERKSEIENLSIKPVFYAMYYIDVLTADFPDDKDGLEAELARLAKLGQPTDEMIKKALLYQANDLIQFYKDFHDIDLSLEEVTRDAMIQMFSQQLDHLENSAKPHIQYILKSLYLANPELLQPLYRIFDKDQAEQKMYRESLAHLEQSMKKQRMLAYHALKTAPEVSIQQDIVAKMDAIMKAPQKDYVETAESLLANIRRGYKYKSVQPVLMNKLNKMIDFFTKLDPRTDLETHYAIQLTLIRAVIDRSLVDKAKKEATDMLLNLKYPQSQTKQYIAECKKDIDNAIKKLNKEWVVAPAYKRRKL